MPLILPTLSPPDLAVHTAWLGRGCSCERSPRRFVERGELER
jgi:hypothetical protein